MYFVNEHALYAWRDLDPHYVETGRSSVTDPWISQSSESPRQWAVRTARRLLTSATVGVETRLFHMACDRELCAANPFCRGETLNEPTRYLFAKTTEAMKHIEGKLVMSLCAERGPNTDVDDVTEVLYEDKMSAIIETMFRSVFEQMHELLGRAYDDLVYRTGRAGTAFGGLQPMDRAYMRVADAIYNEASEAGVPLEQDA